MKTTIELTLESLHNQVLERDQKIVNLETNNQSLRQSIDELQKTLDWFKRQLFGKKSERDVPLSNAEQITFEGFESPQAPVEQQDVPAHKRCKPERNSSDAIQFPADIPVQEVRLDVPEVEKTCPETGVPLIKIGEEISCKLAQIAAKYFIKKIIRPKYAHPQKPENGIVAATLPDSIIPKCRADESLLADIITRKFADHMPLYRISEEIGRHGISISHKLLSSWVVRCGLALTPLYDLMLQQILAGENIYVDESPIKIQAKGTCDTGYMWVVVGGQGPNPPYRAYEFRNNRRHENAADLFKNYRAALHSDKYGAYQALAEKKQITWNPCWSHIRRKFFEAEGGDARFRSWALRKIRYLFMLERVAWARTPEERLEIRREKEGPIIDELTAAIHEKMKDRTILPKSKLREAMGYFCSLTPYLKNYMKHPDSRLDNNVAERAIRPIAIGRKNWIFFGSENGGKAGAVLLSLVQTCRELQINPREYLEDVLRRFMGHSARRLGELLPDQWFAARQVAKQNPS